MLFLTAAYNLVITIKQTAVRYIIRSRIESGSNRIVLFLFTHVVIVIYFWKTLNSVHSYFSGEVWKSSRQVFPAKVTRLICDFSDLHITFSSGIYTLAFKFTSNYDAPAAAALSVRFALSPVRYYTLLYSFTCLRTVQDKFSPRNPWYVLRRKVSPKRLSKENRAF